MTKKRDRPSRIDKSTVQKVLEAVEEFGDTPVTAHEIADKTGIPPRIVSSRLSFLRQRGDVFSVQRDDEQGRLIVYVAAGHALAIDPEKKLCHASNEWLRVA